MGRSVAAATGSITRTRGWRCRWSYWATWSPPAGLPGCSARPNTSEATLRAGHLPRWAGLVAVLVVAFGLRVVAPCPLPANGLLAPSDSLRRLGTQSRDGDRPERVYLLGRPSLMFYLTSRHTSEVVRLATEADLPQKQSIRRPDSGSSLAKVPRVIVDGAVAPLAVAKLFREAGSRIDFFWDHGSLANWLDQDPELAFQLGRGQGIVAPDRPGDPDGLRESGGPPYWQRIVIYSY